MVVVGVGEGGGGDLEVKGQTRHLPGLRERDRPGELRYSVSHTHTHSPANLCTHSLPKLLAHKERSRQTNQLEQ